MLSDALKLFYNDEHGLVIDICKLVIELVPDNLEAYWLKGKIHDQMNQTEKAEADYRKLIKLEPNNIDYYDSLAQLLIRQGKYNEATKIFQKPIENYPNNENFRPVRFKSHVNKER